MANVEMMSYGRTEVVVVDNLPTTGVYIGKGTKADVKDSIYNALYALFPNLDCVLTSMMPRTVTNGFWFSVEVQ